MYRRPARTAGDRDAPLLGGSPFAAEAGLKLVFADRGRAAVSLPARSNTERPVHRGLITALVEAAAGAAALESEGQRAESLSQVSITFLRPAKHPLVGEARMLAREGSPLSCEVDVHDWNGMLVARGFLTYAA